MIIIGIVSAILGLVLFMIGGVLTNDSPGIERSHALFMGFGFLLLMVGLVLTVGAVV